MASLMNRQLMHYNNPYYNTLINPIVLETLEAGINLAEIHAPIAIKESLSNAPKIKDVQLQHKRQLVLDTDTDVVEWLVSQPNIRSIELKHVVLGVEASVSYVAGILTQITIGTRSIYDVTALLKGCAGIPEKCTTIAFTGTVLGTIAFNINLCNTHKLNQSYAHYVSHIYDAINTSNVYGLRFYASEIDVSTEQKNNVGMFYTYKDQYTFLSKESFTAIGRIYIFIGDTASVYTLQDAAHKVCAYRNDYNMGKKRFPYYVTGLSIYQAEIHNASEISITKHNRSATLLMQNPNISEYSGAINVVDWTAIEHVGFIPIVSQWFTYKNQQFQNVPDTIKVSLCNPSYIRESNLAIGTKVCIGPLGKIYRIIKRLHTPNDTQTPIDIPSTCPECGSSLIERDDLGVLVCSNAECKYAPII
jgi:hypothetical protein